jgi:hypothetical protein
MNTNEDDMNASFLNEFEKFENDISSRLEYLKNINITNIVNKYSTYNLNKLESLLVSDYNDFIEESLINVKEVEDILKFHLNDLNKQISNFKKYTQETYIPGSALKILNKNEEYLIYVDCDKSITYDIDHTHPTCEHELITINNVIHNLKKKRKELNK